MPIAARRGRRVGLVLLAAVLQCVLVRADREGKSWGCSGHVHALFSHCVDRRTVRLREMGTA